MNRITLDLKHSNDVTRGIQLGKTVKKLKNKNIIYFFANDKVELKSEIIWDIIIAIIIR